MAEIKASAVNLGFVSGSTTKKLAGCKSINVKLTAQFDEERDKSNAGHVHREFQWCELSGSASGNVQSAGTTEFDIDDMQGWAQSGAGPAVKLLVGTTSICHCSSIKITGFTINAPVEGRANWTLNFTGVGKAINQ